MKKFFSFLENGIHDSGEAKAFIDAAMDAVNPMGTNLGKMADDILENGTMTSTFLPIAFALVEQLDRSYKNGQFDDRNAACCETASKLMKLEQIRKCAEGSYEMSVLGSAENAMSRQHRTLQQQFSTVIFKFLFEKLSKENRISKEDLTAVGIAEEFWYMPYI